MMSCNRLNLVLDTSTANLPLFTSGRGNNHHLGVVGNEAGKGATGTKAFIIWMDENTKNAHRGLCCGHIIQDESPLDLGGVPDRCLDQPGDRGGMRNQSEMTSR